MRVRSILRGVLLAFVLAAAGLGGFVWWNLHDRSPGSRVQRRRPAHALGARAPAGRLRTPHHQSRHDEDGLGRRLRPQSRGHAHSRRLEGRRRRHRRRRASHRPGGARRHRLLSRRGAGRAPQPAVVGAPRLRGGRVHAQSLRTRPDGHLGAERFPQRHRPGVPDGGGGRRGRSAPRRGRGVDSVVGVVRGGAARSRRTRGRFPRPAGLRRHAAADALHARRRLDGRHARQLGQSSRNALGGQHRVDGGFSRLPARHARGGRDAGRPPGRSGPRRHARLRERRDRRADDHRPADDRGRPLHPAAVHRAVARQGARAGAPAGASGAGRGARRRRAWRRRSRESGSRPAPWN